MTSGPAAASPEAEFPGEPPIGSIPPSGPALGLATASQAPDSEGATPHGSASILANGIRFRRADQVRPKTSRNRAVTRSRTRSMATSLPMTRSSDVTP